MKLNEVIMHLHNVNQVVIGMYKESGGVKILFNDLIKRYDAYDFQEYYVEKIVFSKKESYYDNNDAYIDVYKIEK